MKIIIAGAGRVGGTLAEVLSKEGHDVAVIDRDGETISHVSGDADVICIEGSATDADVLLEAGAETADLLIAATQKDEINMVCSISARKLGTKHVIARVRDPEYIGKTEFLQDAFGISFLVNPEYECAKEISRVLRFPGAARVDNFSRGSLEIAEHRVAEGGPLVGTALKELNHRFGSRILVALVERGGEAVIPDGDFVLEADDRLSLTGTAKEVRKFFSAVGAYRKPVKSVIIMGGSRIAVYLTQILSESGILVSVIEESRERCDELCELIPNARVICGDATKRDVLLEEGIKGKDAFVALTDDDGNNIITSIYSHSLGVGKTVVQVNKEHFAEMLDFSELDCVVSPKDVVIQIITRYVRAMSNSVEYGSIETLYKLSDGKAEAIEFVVGENTSVTGIPLKDMHLKPDVLISAVIRNNRCIIPDGTTQMLPGDHVVIVTTAGWLKDINDIV